MWRAFFFACGVMLIILGVECIVIGRFVISPESTITKVARKVLGNDAVPLGQSPQLAGANGFGSPPSGYGQSRFNDNPFSVANNQRGLSNPFNLASQRSGAAFVGPAKPGRIITTEDWMPWSLIAAGTIVTLYTHSLSKSYQQQ